MRSRVGMKGRLLLCTAASALASAAGIYFAVRWGTSSDGGRGGAVAVAITFGAMLMYSGLPGELIEARDEDGLPAFDHLGEKRFAHLRTALALLLDRQRLEARYLTVSGVTGALMWGFGDVIAAWLGAAAG